MTKRATLDNLAQQMDESMGLREAGQTAVLTPVANPKDRGRRAVNNVGRLSLDQLMPDPTQPRTEFDSDDIRQLAHSLQETGQLHPLHVRWSATDNKWLIISGERRFRAAQQAGLSTVDCYFHEGELSDSTILEQQLIENLLRADLKPLEEAHAFRQLITINSWSGAELAQSLRISRARVTRSLALLKLPPEIQELVAKGKLAPSVAYELSKLKNEQQQWAVIANQSLGKLTTKGVNRQVRKRSGRKTSRGSQLKFLTESGWTIQANCKTASNYCELEQGLLEALDEVRLRIGNGVVLMSRT